jgi:hypothetical protein
MNLNILMPDTSTNHIEWLKKREESFTTSDGLEIQVWDFEHDSDPDVFSGWARHFRNHYCTDDQIDFLKGHLSRKQYLTEMKFPTEAGGLGPATRAGDFGEILVADFLQWMRGFWVPRFRWGSKIIQNESPKGSDVVGFFQNDPDKYSPQDTLIVYETKTKFSANRNNVLQNAINDSAKDHLRLAESLNFIKQKLLDRGEHADMMRVARFQNPADHPYQEVFGAAEIISSEFVHTEKFSDATATEIPVSKNSSDYLPHPNRDKLEVIVISGANMMELVHALYEAAADEA